MSFRATDAPLTRKCGDCQLCCKLLPLSGDNAKSWRTATLMIAEGVAKLDDFGGMMPELKKPANQRCIHQRHGKGCAVYDKRPFSCRTWSCRWLVEDDTEGLARPDRAHYVIDLVPDYVTAKPHDGSASVDIPMIQIWVDPKFPDAHRDPALRAYIQRQGEKGQGAIIRFSESKAIALFPPSLSQDGQWHEIEGEMTRRANT
jgi:hypothetical protein